MLNEKEIDKLKSIVKVHKDFFEDGDTETINSEEIKALEHLLLEYEELKILKDDIKDKRIVYIDELEFEENYIPKQKIRDIFDVKIHNYKYLAETDWSDWLKEADRHIAELLEIILEELLGKED